MTKRECEQSYLKRQFEIETSVLLATGGNTHFSRAMQTNSI